MTHSPRQLTLRMVTRVTACLGWCGSFTALLWLGCGVAAAATALAGSSEPAFRIGFSSSLLREFNENDAKASMKVWVMALVRERGLQADPDIKMFKDLDALRQGLRDQTVDGLVLPIDEYWVLNGPVSFNRFLIPIREGDITEEYLLLVHQESAITRVEDLRGRSLSLLQHSKMCLAKPWLDILLLRAGLKPADEVLNKISEFDKLTKVVLPVFFRQTDACVVTRKGFRTMVELNPQVGKQLRIVATSEAIVPTGFFFRTGAPAQPQARMFVELQRLHSTAAGQQVLTVFQTDRLEEQPVSCLNRSLELLETFHRLLSQTNRVQVSTSTAASAGGEKGGL